MSLLRNLVLVQRLGTSTVEARSSLEEPGRAYSHRGGPAWAEGEVRTTVNDDQIVYIGQVAPPPRLQMTVVFAVSAKLTI